MICPVEGSTDTKDMCSDGTSPNTCGGSTAPTPTSAPTPTQAPTPTSAPTPVAGPGQCCYGGCGGDNCQGGWCGESQAQCEGNCNGEFCPAASLASTRLRGEIAAHDTDNSCPCAAIGEPCCGRYCC